MKLCVQSGEVVFDYGYEKGYAMFREAGFEAIDWNIDVDWDRKKVTSGIFEGASLFEKPIEEIIAHYADEVAILKKNGLVLSQAHAPFPAYVHTCPQMLDYSIEVYKKCIELCAYYECRNLVVHGISLTAADNVNTPADIDALNMKLYESLIPTLLKVDGKVTVCLENLFSGKGKNFYEGTCSDPHQAVAYIDALNAKAGREVFGFCLDTGHINLLQKDFRTYVPILGKRIKALHIHDNDGLADAHLAPYTGSIDWKAFYNSLREIGYDGDLDFETFAQTRKSRLDAELVPSYLKLIADCGVFFRKKITE